jgi:hypothetical protein
MSFEDEVRERIRAAKTLDELALVLERLLSLGVVVDEGGRLKFIRALVDRVEGLRIVIWPRDHAPPHFHVEAPGVSAAFTISDCSPLSGRLSKQQEALVRYWYLDARPKLVEHWNRLRPSDCPAGPIRPDRA